VNKLEKQVEQWQKALMAPYLNGREMHFRTLDKRVCVAYSTSPPVGNAMGLDPQFIGILPRIKAVVIKMDVREYSRRSTEDQLFLTSTFFAWIERARDLLTCASLLTKDEPRITIQEGDAAYFIFTPPSVIDFEEKSGALSKQLKTNMDKLSHTEDWRSIASLKNVFNEFVAWRDQCEREELPIIAGQAFSLIFALNALMKHDNGRKAFSSHNEEQALPPFPVESRFAASYDDVLLLRDINRQLNCVGNGVVTCGRIISADHGGHLLVHHELFKALDTHGGLENLCSRRWGQQFHSAVFDAVKIKTGEFRYVDIFGYHNDRPLLDGLHLYTTPSRVYSIGSHDVRCLELGK
jgi:hypothetical protein